MTVESATLQQELSVSGQEMVEEVWGNVTATAPREDWQYILGQFIAAFHSDESSAAAGAAHPNGGMGGCTVYKGTAIGSGYAASHTGNSCTKAYLSVDIQVQGGGPGDLRSCFNCRSVWVAVSFSSCNYYVAIGRHEWGYPSGGATTSDDNNAGCDD